MSERHVSTSMAVLCCVAALAVVGSQPFSNVCPTSRDRQSDCLQATAACRWLSVSGNCDTTAFQVFCHVWVLPVNWLESLKEVSEVRTFFPWCSLDLETPWAVGSATGSYCSVWTLAGSTAHQALISLIRVNLPIFLTYASSLALVLDAVPSLLKDIDHSFSFL